MDAVDTATTLGAFIGAKLHAINTLNREFDRRKEDISKMKEEIDDVNRQHKTHVANLEKASEDKYNELQVKNISL